MSNEEAEKAEPRATVHVPIDAEDLSKMQLSWNEWSRIFGQEIVRKRLDECNSEMMARMIYAEVLTALQKEIRHELQTTYSDKLHGLVAQLFKTDTVKQIITDELLRVIERAFEFSFDAPY